jgi:hypothetical protein
MVLQKHIVSCKPWLSRNGRPLACTLPYHCAIVQMACTLPDENLCLSRGMRAG